MIKSISGTTAAIRAWLAGVYANRYTQCFSNFLKRCAEFAYIIGMSGNATVKAQNNRDGDCDQFTCFGIEVTGLRSRLISLRQRSPKLRKDVNRDSIRMIRAVALRPVDRNSFV